MGFYGPNGTSKSYLLTLNLKGNHRNRMKRLQDAKIADICSKPLVTTHERLQHKGTDRCTAAGLHAEQQTSQNPNITVSSRIMKSQLWQTSLENVAGWDKKSQYVVAFKLNFDK